MEPKRNQGAPKAARRELKRKGRQREPKGSQRAPKGNQGGTKRHPKIRLGARVDFGSEKGGYHPEFLGAILEQFSTKKSIKIDAKIDVKKT